MSDEEDGMARQTVEERFWSKVHGVVETRCLEWQGYRSPDGYGRFKYEGESRMAHRVAWCLEYGRWPEHSIDHLCRNRACVNPDHLEDIDIVVNIRRGDVGKYMADRDECVNGHPYTPENTAYWKNGRGRRCKTCKREATAASRKRAEAQNGA